MEDKVHKQRVWHTFVWDRRTCKHGCDVKQEMVCLEPAVAGSGPVILQPGASWSAKQKLSLRKLSDESV